MQASNSKFKRLIKAFGKLIIFLGIVVGILLVLSYFLDPVKTGAKGNAYEREQYLAGILSEEKDTVDVVILGDSESFGLLSPMHLWQDKGITAYIAGQGGLRTVEEYYSLKKILKKQSPKLVILETNNLFDEMGNMAEIKYCATTTVYHYFPVVKYHSMWKKYIDDDIMDDKHFNGFEARTNIAPYTGEYMVYTDEIQSRNKIIEHYLTKTIELCKSEGIEVLLVSTPSPSHCNYKTHNSIVEYADKVQVPYIDMNTLDELNISLTDDMLDGGDHVNYAGTLKMTAYMEKYLDDNYDLPDRRGDEKYSFYNDRAKEFFDSVSGN